MAAPPYKYLVVDALTQDPVAEVPLTNPTFSYLLNGAGTFTASMPADASFASEAIFQDTMREMTVLRDEEAVWNGPFTNLTGSRRGGWELTAREASWWFLKRTIEDLLVYTSMDIFGIFRALVTYATGKTANGSDGMTAGASINAALPNLAVVSGLAGVTKSYSFAADQGYLIGDGISDILVGDPSTGLDYAMDYSTGSTRQSCQRTVLLGSPQLGVQQEIILRQNDLYDYGRTMDWEGAATRATVVGGGGYVSRKQNSTAVATGEPLTETVLDRGDISDHDAIDNLARDLRHASKPPVHDRWVEWVPNEKKLPWGWAKLGDMLPLDVAGPGMLQLTADHRRAVRFDVTPPGRGTPERVRATLSISTDEVTT